MSMIDDRLNTKIFLTDSEFGRLFGPDIARLVGIMNAAAVNICPGCNGYCCKNIGCLFYSEYFSTCPIFDRRPRECRYHFCNEVFNAAPLTREEKDLMQQPVEDLICGSKGEIARLFFLFPEFPLDEKGLTALGIKDDVLRIRGDFEDGKLQQEEAFKRLRQLCRDDAAIPS
ncbi:MAG: hypothetical protein WC541_01245 [Dehalococcoidia bacterium]